MSTFVVGHGYLLILRERKTYMLEKMTLMGQAPCERFGTIETANETKAMLEERGYIVTLVGLISPLNTGMGNE